MAENDVLDSLSKYEDAFDISAFFQQYYCNTEGTSGKHMQHTLRCYHNAFQDLPNSGLKVMDYASGGGARGGGKTGAGSQAGEGCGPL